MARMKALRLHGIGDLRFEEVDAPGAPGASEVLLAVRAAGICGSDLHNFRTGQWISRLPAIPGHEFCAEVVAVGSAVRGLVPGMLVVADSRVGCGECGACIRGEVNRCARLGFVGEVRDGGFAQFCRLPASLVFPVPAGVSPRMAALAEPLAVSLHALRRLEAGPGDPIVIAGAGPIGGFAAVLAAHLGLGPLGIIERNAERARRVQAASGAQLLAATPEAIAAFAGERLLRHAVEATGQPQLVDLVIGGLAPGGRVVLVGLGPAGQAVPLHAIVERELDVRGCSAFGNEMPDVLAWLPLLAARLEDLASPPIALAAVPGEYDHLMQGRSGFVKTIIAP